MSPFRTLDTQFPVAPGLARILLRSALRFTQLTTKCGFCSSTDFHTALSASVLLAAYTIKARSALYGGGAHASRTAPSSQVFLSILSFFPGFGIVAAVLEDVCTKRLMLCSLAADLRVPVAPATVARMTSCGFGEKDMEAVWAVASTPYTASSKAPSRAMASTIAVSYSGERNSLLVCSAFDVERTVPRTRDPIQRASLMMRDAMYPAVPVTKRSNPLKRARSSELVAVILKRRLLG